MTTSRVTATALQPLFQERAKALAIRGDWNVSWKTTLGEMQEKANALGLQVTIHVGAPHIDGWSIFIHQQCFAMTDTFWMMPDLFTQMRKQVGAVFERLAEDEDGDTQRLPPNKRRDQWLYEAHHQAKTRMGKSQKDVNDHLKMIGVEERQLEHILGKNAKTIAQHPPEVEKAYRQAMSFRLLDLSIRLDGWDLEYFVCWKGITIDDGGGEIEEIEIPDLTADHLAAWRWIVDRCKNGVCPPTLSELGVYLGVAPSTARKYLAVLCAHKYLEKIEGKHRAINILRWE